MRRGEFLVVETVVLAQMRIDILQGNEEQAHLHRIHRLARLNQWVCLVDDGTTLIDGIHPVQFLLCHENPPIGR